MYTVYKITNRINGKYYIGVHKTNNPYDFYYGSGTVINNAIKKYGKENFIKEILLITKSKEEAYKKEKELVVVSEETYNIKNGGQGGWSFESCIKGGKNIPKELKSKNSKINSQLKIGIHKFSSSEKSIFGKKGGINNKGKPKSKEHKDNISKSLKGKKYKPRRPS